MRVITAVLFLAVAGCSTVREEVPDLFDDSGWLVLPVPSTNRPTINPANPSDVTPADDVPVTDIVKTYDGGPLPSTLTCNLGLKRVWKDTLLRWEYDRPFPWTETWKGCVGNCWLFLKRDDGKWEGGPGDWLRKGQNYKNAGDFKFTKDGTVCHIQKGQEFLVMLSTPVRNGVRKTGFRTNIRRMIVR